MVRWKEGAEAKTVGVLEEERPSGNTYRESGVFLHVCSSSVRSPLPI